MPYANGASYVGECCCGCRDGDGLYIFPNGTSNYQGQWRGDKKHGKGCLTWAQAGNVVASY